MGKPIYRFMVGGTLTSDYISLEKYFFVNVFSSVFVNPQNMFTALLLFDFKAYKLSLDSYRK
jgi:hypothetical protein